MYGWGKVLALSLKFMQPFWFHDDYFWRAKLDRIVGAETFYN